MITRDELSELAMIDVSQDRVETPKGFYSSVEWKALTNTLLETHPHCQLCLSKSITRQSKEVHHIVPISKGGELLSEANLICLCDSCHRDIHSQVGFVISESMDFGDRWFEDYVKEYNDHSWTPNLQWEHYDAQIVRYWLSEAAENEKEDPEVALRLYRKIIKFLEKYDAWCKRNKSKTFRQTRFPIDRVTIFLKKQKRYRECLDFMEWYETIEDQVGLNKAESIQLPKRKEAVQRKLNEADSS
jgi:hypothetical protein